MEPEACRVIGVVAPGFSADKPVDLWLPLRADFESADHIGRVRVAARLKPGVMVKNASANVAAMMRRFSIQYPFVALLSEEFRAIPLRDAVVGDVRPALVLLTGAVGFVLVDLPRVGADSSTITFDANVFFFTLIVSLLSALLFGLTPALSVTRVDVMSLVKE